MLAQEHAIKMREVERGSQARKQELDREHNAELIALTEDWNWKEKKRIRTERRNFRKYETTEN